VLDIVADISVVDGTDGTWYKWYIRKIEKGGERGKFIYLYKLCIIYIIIYIIHKYMKRL